MSFSDRLEQHDGLSIAVNCAHNNVKQGCICPYCNQVVDPVIDIHKHFHGCDGAPCVCDDIVAHIQQIVNDEIG